jgi:hypothetical protein
MRKIEQQMLEAISANRHYWKKDNTEVHTLPINKAIRVLLHNNIIAIIDQNTNTLTLYDCGYKTTTTKSRFNALLTYYNKGRIYSINKHWMYCSDYPDTSPITRNLWKGELTLDLQQNTFNTAKTPDNLEFVF